MPDKKKVRPEDKVSLEVMEMIRHDEVKMRPRAYFVLGSILVGVGLVLSILLGAILLHAIRFHLLMMEKVFGLPWWVKVYALLHLFPWSLLFFLAGLLGLGMYLLNKYEFTYKQGLLAVLIGFGSGIVVLSLLIHRIGVDQQIRRVPVGRGIYQIRQMPPEFERKIIRRYEPENGRILFERKVYP